MKLNILALKPINPQGVSFYWNGTCDFEGSQNYQSGLDPLACPCKHLSFGYDSRDYIREQLNLVIILRLDILLVNWSNEKIVLNSPFGVKRSKDSDSLFSLYQFNDITVANFNFHFCTNAKRRYIR